MTARGFNLQQPQTAHQIVHDDRSMFGVTIQTRDHALFLLVNVHLQPKLSHAAQSSALRAVSALYDMVKPALAIVGRDFNMSMLVNSPRRCACGLNGRLRPFRPMLTPGTPTTYTTRRGHVTATAIDQVFIRGSLADHNGILLPAPKTHPALYMAFTPTTAKPDPYSWKRFRWRLATPEQLQPASAIVSLV